MNLFKITLTLTLFLFSATCFSQETSTINCSIFKSGKFKYLDAIDTTAYIIMAADKQTEYSGKNDYFIESSIKWITDCSYSMKMTKITIPDFPYKAGDIMKVDITKIEDDIIYYTSTVKGVSWKGRFRKLRE